MAHSSISHLRLDGTYCLPQHLCMSLGMFHLESEASTGSEFLSLLRISEFFRFI